MISTIPRKTLTPLLKKNSLKKKITINYDLLKTVCTNKRFIRPVLDTDLDNCVDNKNNKVFELKPTKTLLDRKCYKQSKVVMRRIITRSQRHRHLLYRKILNHWV